ncbi:KIZ protein, partial [Sagittarius serpentarius]|nr:KIZ protein [Sagittarius serpentarius]
SEAKRLELERKLMEYRKSDTYLMKLKYMKLKKYLKEIDERQKRALLRNQTFLKEFDQFEAHMKTSSSEMIQKMEAWYGREIRSVLSLQEGNLSAEGDVEEYNEQMPQGGRQAGISTKTAVPRELYHPATVDHHTSSALAAGGLGTQQNHPQPTESCSAPDPPSCSPSLDGLGPESRSADLESDTSVEGAARCKDLAASEEGSKLISSISDPKPATEEEEQPRGSAPGSKPCLSNWWTCKEASWESNVELPGPASAREVMPSTPGVPQGTSLPAAGWEQGRDARAVESSLLQPPNPPVAQEEPSVGSTPDGFCNWAGSLKEDDLEACEAVVLYQLRALLQRALNGCLLPEKTLYAKDQQWNMDMLRTCLSEHALFLKKHQVQLTKEVAEMFESLLVSSKKAQDSQALPVLREALPEECGDRSSIQSNESSCSLPSIPNDGGEIKQEKYAPWLAGTGGQGWDSGNNSSKAKASQEIHSETSSSSNERSLPFSRTESRKGVVAAIKSKAFWGESDDSSSEIEAALRPQTHSTEADEFDDFYD